MTPLTLRTTLTLAFTVVLALLLTAVGVAYYHALSLQLDSDATSELGEVTSALHGYLRFDNGVPELVYDRNDPEQVAFVERAARYYQIFEADSGRLVLQSAALVPLGLQLTPSEVHAFRDRSKAADVWTDQGRLRFSNSLIAPAPGELYLLQVGVRLDAYDRALDRFLALLLWSLPACVIVAGLAGRWMAGRALAPLVRLAAASHQIEVTDLSRRLPVRGAGDELDAVAHAFNDTLGRLEHAVGDMKQFSTALAHELRTPLAALRGETELALLHARSPDEYRRSLASQLEELDRLTRLINQLLTLARAEAGEIPVAHVPVDLAPLATSVVQSLEPVSKARGVALTCLTDDQGTVVGDAGWLERLLISLVDNAIKFTAAGGEIVVTVTRQAGCVVLTVRDTGAGIAAEALPHIFDRFYQADPSRTSATGGVGLGLSLVRWIVQRHVATIDVTSVIGTGTTFTVRWPPPAVGAL